MSSTKVLVWVLSASLGATALMFGVASLIRAGDSGTSLGVSMSGIEDDPLGDVRVENDVVRRRYVRLCQRNQWDNVSDMLAFGQKAMAYLTLNEDKVTPVTRAMLGEQLAIAGVILGKLWSEIRATWRNDDLRDLHPPTRRELAATTEWCVRDLTSMAERWIEVAEDS